MIIKNAVMSYTNLDNSEVPATYLCGSCLIGCHSEYYEALKCVEANDRQPKTDYDAITHKILMGYTKMHKILMGYTENLANKDEKGNVSGMPKYESEVMSFKTQDQLEELESCLRDSIEEAIDSVDTTNGLDAQTMKSVSMALCDKLSTAIANWEKEIAEAMAASVTTPVGNITKPQKTLPQAWKEMGMCVQCGSEGEQRGMSWHCSEHGYMYGI